MAHWLLQGNPNRWLVHDFFRDHTAAELTSWSVTRYLDDLSEGDGVALWLAGPDGGVVALGTVAGPVEQAVGSEDPYSADAKDAAGVRWIVPLQLLEVFNDHPIPRGELREDPRFSSAMILRQPSDGNPFRLIDDEWDAILERQRQSEPTIATSSALRAAWWALRPGDRIRRRELHDRYGGSRQDGISPSRLSPNIFIFTDPRSGEKHGYFDSPGPDGSLHYTGRGQRGDQTLTSGNRAILYHRENERALRVFQGASGVVRYMGEYVLNEHDPYSWERAPSTGGGPPRQVIRFHLLRVSRSAVIQDPSQLGVPFRDRDETIEIAGPAVREHADPDAIGRGLRAHYRLQNRLSKLVRAAGYEPLDPSPIDPDFDLAWTTPKAIFVVEVKSCTKANEVRQLRLGIGQVLDYEDTLRVRKEVQAVLYLERAPSDLRWVDLAERHHIRLSWPGTEHLLGLAPVDA